MSNVGAYTTCAPGRQKDRYEGGTKRVKRAREGRRVPCAPHAVDSVGQAARAECMHLHAPHHRSDQILLPQTVCCSQEYMASIV